MVTFLEYRYVLT